ncbi:MAG: PKD domain-containing protein [Lacibacter sp.]
MLLALPFAGSSQLSFVENKGQWDKQVLFKTNAGNSTFFLVKDGYTILMHNPEDYERLVDYNHGHSNKLEANEDGKEMRMPGNMRAHAFNVKFLGGNFNSQPVMEKPLPGVENYFIGNDPSKWGSNCKLYQAVTYKNVYPGVDVRYYVLNEQLKYDIIVYPGADVSKIKMKYEGADQLSIRNNELIVGTSVGEARELKPYSYQFVGGRRETVNCKYKIEGTTVSFDIKNFDRATTLIIDPTIVFSSFSGSTGDNWGFTATPGPDGSFYGGGIAVSTGFPTSPGAIQSTGGGPSNSSAPPDIAIIRLSPDGRTRIYATYIGGNGLEQPHSLFADASGNLVIAGRTNSSNFPTTATFGTIGGFDIFVTKINATGTAIIGSSRIGGNADDGVNIAASRNGVKSLQRNYGDDGRSEVIIGPGNNIYLASSTQTTGTGFYTRGAFQTTSGGSQDAVVIKLSPNADNVIWSTYLGGSGDDAGFVLAIDPLNTQNIYVGGGTGSSAFPGTSAANVYQPTIAIGDIADGYLAKLTDLGTSVSLDKSTYLGTNKVDLIYGVQFDQKGFPYVMGTTTGTMTSVNAAYSVSNARQFIAKFQPELNALVYLTTFGTANAANPNISPVAFLVDNCENVYVSGWGGQLNTSNGYPSAGTSGLPVSSDAFQRNTDGSDFYFFVLKKNASAELYGSFFGQVGGAGSLEHVDGGTSRFDANGVIYQAVCANCKGVRPGTTLVSPYPVTAGVWSPSNPSNNGGMCNLGMIKMRFDLAGVDVAIRAVGAKQLNFCLPATVQFTDTIKMAKQYIWIWGDGTNNDTTSVNPYSHTFTTSGYFNIKVIGIDSTSCNIKDSALMRIRVTTDSVDVGFNYTRQSCNSLTFNFTNTSDILTSSRPFGPKSFMWVWGDGSKNDTTPGFSPPVAHTFPSVGSYNVRLVLIDSNYCNMGDSMGIVNFQVIDQVKAGFRVGNVCAPDTVAVTDASVGALSYLWVSSDGQTSTKNLPDFVYTTPGTYSIKQYVYNSNSCNLVDSITQSFNVVGPPTAGFFYNPNPSQENTPTRFTSTASADVVKWFWDFGDGDTSSLRDPVHQYIKPAINVVCQTVTNSDGCQDSVCIPVESIINVVNDLPSAFTPNGDGVNDVFMVRGFGITKMTLRIYNRQGLMVFESRSQKVGWNGTYKGVQQPMDAYAWTLDVEYFTGEMQRKKGDVTLIR